MVGSDSGEEIFDEGLYQTPKDTIKNYQSSNNITSGLQSLVTQHETHYTILSECLQFWLEFESMVTEQETEINN